MVRDWSLRETDSIASANVQNTYFYLFRLFMTILTFSNFFRLLQLFPTISDYSDFLITLTTIFDFSYNSKKVHC